MINFRPLDLESDAADLARLYSSTTAEPVTADTIRDWWAPRAGEIRVTTLAVDEHGRTLGYWDVDRETWMRPGHWFIKVIVDPQHRLRGLGSQMYDAAQAVCLQHSATHLVSRVKDNDEGSIRFATRRGFQVEHHSFESTLDLLAFDESRFTAIFERVKDFRFFTLAEAGVTDQNKRRLYEVNRASGVDNPGNNGAFPDFDSFSMNVFNASWFRPDTQLLAAHGENWVGLSAISIDDEQGYSYNAFTGVLREYRGRGLAQALKLQTILLAKRAGMRYIRTNNDSQNAPMLAVNRKLGYKPEPGLYQVICALG